MAETISSYAIKFKVRKMKFTVFGSKGFIGKNIVEFLKKQNHECFCPMVLNDEIFSKPLGNIIYAIGVSDSLRRPFDTTEAHVCLLKKILSNQPIRSPSTFLKRDVCGSGVIIGHNTAL